MRLYLGFDCGMNSALAVSRSFTRILRKLNHHRTTELYFVGYPKTGNTWIRYMLGRYIQLHCNLSDLPLFDATDVWGNCETFCVGPAMQFTHRPLIWHNQQASDLTYRNVIRPYSEKRVVLLVRHPLDTLVSHWMQRLFRTEENYTGRLTEFLDDPVWGIEKYFRFYTLWFDHRHDVKDFLLVRYEDMRARPQQVFTQLLEYLAIPQKEETIRSAVSDADFDSMKRVETAGEGPTYRSSGNSIFASGDPSNPDAFHVRRGVVGGYVDYLDSAEFRKFLSLIDERLPASLGYGNQ